MRRITMTEMWTELSQGRGSASGLPIPAAAVSASGAAKPSPPASHWGRANGADLAELRLRQKPLETPPSATASLPCQLTNEDATSVRN